MSDEVQRSLGRIESKLDEALAGVKDHEGRISSLEKWQSWTFGAAAALGLVLGLVWKVLPHAR